MRRQLFLTALAAGVMLVLLAGVRLEGQERSVNPGINKPFEDPDVEAFRKRFETESREVYTRRLEIIEALGLRRGMAVADIGAGTGLFTRLIAERVGREGKVYAVDISPAFLRHIAAESKRLGQTQVETVRCPQDATNLPARSVDLAFLCDVYHHLEYPAKTLGSIHEALRPGGQLVVVEFDRRRAREAGNTFVPKHVRADKETFLAEIEQADFERLEAGPAPALKENFWARFRKKERPAPPSPDRPAPRPAPARDD